MIYLDSFNELLTKKLLATGKISENQFKYYKIFDFQNNFYEKMSDSVIAQFKDGDGDEISSGKMKSIRSSSAMTYNLLGNGDVEIVENGMIPAGTYKNEFEKKLPLIKESDHKANLDAWLHNDEAEIFVESKCLEWIENGTDRNLNDKYRKTENYYHKETAETFIAAAKQINCPQYDSCQMFRHTLGIYNFLRNEKITGKKVLLVNVVWELSEDADLDATTLRRYKLQEELEHLEFEYFHEQMQAVIDLFAENTGCSFDIEYLTVKQFHEIIKYTEEKKAYLQRYV